MELPRVGLHGVRGKCQLVTLAGYKGIPDQLMQRHLTQPPSAACVRSRLHCGEGPGTWKAVAVQSFSQQHLIVACFVVPAQIGIQYRTVSIEDGFRICAALRPQ